MIKRIFFMAFCFFFSTLITAQTISENDRTEILKVLEDQRIAWNEGDIGKYMEGYWKSDSLRFIGKSGIEYGWQAAYESYLKGYPDKETMGFLDFGVISLEQLNSNTVFMIGKWHLTRTRESVGGYFSLIWKKINGKWLVITDHSS